jgi:carbamoyl-phosphate synthase small subunit
MIHDKKKAQLTLSDGSVWEGYFFGSGTALSGSKKPDLQSGFFSQGEVVFNTGMVGYPETLTDPSYTGQILVATYPIVGNYGIPGEQTTNDLPVFFESNRIHIRALIVAHYTENYSHWEAQESLGAWLSRHNIPGITGVDTRALTKHLRESGTMLGTISPAGQKTTHKKIEDPNDTNLVATVSPTEPHLFIPSSTDVKSKKPKKRIVLIDCGAKRNIIRSLLARNVEVLAVPWNYNFLNETYDGILISNGPGDPTQVMETVGYVKKALTGDKPIFGICLGNQILALAAGAKTFKLPYGHRGHNQPCIDLRTKKCVITSQNHGFAVDSKTLPEGWNEWFVNGNDGTNEGIRHARKPFFSVQFHPEATPGPTDTAYLFDEFLKSL